MLAAVYSTVRMLLRDASTDHDNLIEQCYARVLADVTRTSNWMAERVTIPTTAGQQVYTLPVRAYRPILIFFSGQQLQRVEAESIDLLLPHWRSDAPGTPLYWWMNQLDPAVDTLPDITPQQFIVHPAPSAASGSLVVYATYVPGVDDEIPRWLVPFVSLRTAAAVLRESGIYREEWSEREQAAVQAAQFFDAVADVWRSVLDRALGV